MEKCSVQRFLLVTSDDFGYSEERDDGIIECYKSGAITGAVAMVNGISVATGVIKAKQAGMPLDLHMNLTEGLPVGPREGQYQTLVNEKGMFLGIQGFRDAVSRGDVDMAEVREEMIVQVQRFAELTGHTPVKVDGHQHFHTHPGIVNVYAEVLRQHDIKMSRVPLEEGAPLNAYKEFLVNVIEESKRCKNDFQANGIRSPLFAGLATMGMDMTIKRLQDSILRAFKSGATNLNNDQKPTNPALKLRLKSPRSPAPEEPSVLFCELMTHPGKMTGSKGGCGEGPDLFSQWPDREHEMSILMSEEMKCFYKRENIKLISFHDLEVFTE